MNLSFVDEKYDYVYGVDENGYAYPAYKQPPLREIIEDASKKYSTEFACSVKEKKMRIWNFTFEYNRNDCGRSVSLEGKVSANNAVDAYEKVLRKVEDYEQRTIKEDQVLLFEVWWCPEEQSDVIITERREYDEDE